MLGLHAFALEQAGRCDEAVRAAEAAILRNPLDAWSIHALAHAIYEMAAFDTGIGRLPPAIHPCTHLNWFRNHQVVLYGLPVGHATFAKFCPAGGHPGICCAFVPI